MDVFTFLVAVLLMLLAVQYGQDWLVLGILGVMVLSLRSISTTVLLVIAAAAIYMIRGPDFNAYLPFVLFGLIIVALVFGIRSKPSEPEFYSPGGGYGDLLGGGGV